MDYYTLGQYIIVSDDNLLKSTCKVNPLDKTKDSMTSMTLEPSHIKY